MTPTENAQPQGEGCFWQALSILGIVNIINYFRYKNKHFHHDPSDTTDL